MGLFDFLRGNNNADGSSPKHYDSGSSPYDLPSYGAPPPKNGGAPAQQSAGNITSQPAESYPQIKQPEIDPDDFFSKPAKQQGSKPAAAGNTAAASAPAAPSPAPAAEAKHPEGGHTGKVKFVTNKEEAKKPPKPSNTAFVSVEVPENADPEEKEPMRDAAENTAFVVVEVPENADPEEKEPIKREKTEEESENDADPTVNELGNGAYLVEENGIMSGLNTDALDMGELSGYDYESDLKEFEDTEMLFE